MDKKYPDRKSHFSKEYELYFRNLCKKNGLLINNETIITSIEYALADKRKGFNTFNTYLKKVIKDLRKKLG
ncbi:hypothetical protein LCGC14_0779470 [marine sediment metagenome]|uniref:Uncharacterized protein n=1 Tax=marine sediment metagenome TaxID=412755 RepID=A0A0F9T333_9ZZZZ